MLVQLSGLPVRHLDGFTLAIFFNGEFVLDCCVLGPALQFLLLLLVLLNLLLNEPSFQIILDRDVQELFIEFN